ncbi:hypothetical protein ASG87_01325 [Frateuria sp. Soil773]|uniref:MASE1 domain-containing protein n=1 Tax=Frateuria sp. Soil773 TaxID=1736407 RepID=UPI0006FE313B|nr:MASE1 domain-containing protein [Frateuria sp. Soil773]KRE90805.1 hypothetical protein ASG87_01325 [Frateuria sp. Soil773]
MGYVLLRQVSWSHWILFAGYRFAVLLLVPYRYWPALLAGEMGPVGYASLSCLGDFGWVWSALMLVPPLGLAMPIVRFGREHLKMVPATGPVRVGAVMACTLAVSAVWTLAYVVTLSTARVPASLEPIDYGVEAARWFIGNYLGILTLVPLVLLAWEQRAKWMAKPRAGFARAMQSPLALETATFVLPALAMLVWLGLAAPGESSRSLARLLMFAPVVWLALRHGWYGAAIGVTAASVSVSLTMPALYDPTTLRAEVLVAFAASSMLLFGGRIAVLRRQAGPEGRGGHPLALARRIQAQCEAQLRQGALGVESVSSTVHATEELLFDRLREYRPLIDTRELRRRTTLTREQLFQLADGLYPASLREYGLVAALRHGGLARALNAHRIGYWCQMRGAIQQLSEPLQLTLHRLVCEGASYLCARHSVQDVTVYLRHGQRDGWQWVVVRIDALFSDDPGLQIRGESLAQRLAATGLGVEAIRDRAALYEGVTHVRSSAHGECISVLLREPCASQPQRVAPFERATRGAMPNFS